MEIIPTPMYGVTRLGSVTRIDGGTLRIVPRLERIRIGPIVDHDFKLPPAVETFLSFNQTDRNTVKKETASSPNDSRLAESVRKCQPWTEIIVVPNVRLDVIAEAEHSRRPGSEFQIVLDEK
jgi:hypothetical protein